MLNESQKRDEARRNLTITANKCMDGDFVSAAHYLKEAKDFLNFSPRNEEGRHLLSVYKMLCGRVENKR